MMKITKIKLFITTLLSVVAIHGARAQKVVEYGSPVGFPITLAGNFGEIRSNHFHSGIDIKALQGVGSPIYAVADGYISRISVSPTGYGNMLMVTHPNGTHSLYGHLDGFVEPYTQYIEKEQLRVKRFQVDRYIDAGKFPVKKGEVIGYLGNSGSSAGPHLHFEIRDAAVNAVNPLIKAGYHVADHIAPSAFKVHIYERDTVIFGVPVFAKAQTLELELKGDVYTPKGNLPTISKPFYLAYEVIDYKDGRSNTMGIMAMEQKVNGQKNFGFEIDKISFATTRHINTFVQYDQNSTARFHVLRAYVSSNNKLGVYSGVVNGGIISPAATGQTIDISTTLLDDNANQSEVAIKIKTTAPSTQQYTPSPNDKVAFSNIPFAYADSLISVKFEAGAIYESTFIPISYNDSIFSIGDMDTPLQRGFTLEIEAKIEPQLRSKALLMGKSRKGKWYSVGGTWKGNALSAKLTSFGNFKIAYDTIAPRITPMQKEGTVTTSALKFKITDDLSGISSYDIYIDEKWVIGEYDPRVALLQTPIKKSSTPTEHQVRVVVGDSKGNKKTINQKYKW